MLTSGAGRPDTLRREDMAKDWAKAFYNSREWHVARRITLRRDHYTCHDCEGRAEEVHHITELTPENIHDRMISLNPDNLMCLCHDCHTRRTHKDGDVDDAMKFDDNGYVVRRSPPG